MTKSEMESQLVSRLNDLNVRVMKDVDDAINKGWHDEFVYNALDLYECVSCNLILYAHQCNIINDFNYARYLKGVVGLKMEEIKRYKNRK